MPEIPFVDTLVRNLAPRLADRTVVGVQIRSPSVVKTFDPPLSAMAQRRIEAARRRGKLVVLEMSGGLALVLHLMRDGRLALVPARQRPNRDVSLILGLDGGEDLRLIEIGPKKRAGVYLRRTEDLDSTEPLAGLGIDPLEEAFTAAALDAALDEARVQLKRFLGRQRHLAGIGNAYADEILWEARLSPFAPSQALDATERRRLHDAVRNVLTRAVAEHRAHFGGRLPMREPPELLRVHRHAGEPCPRCGGPIAAVYYAERETYYCPACQTGGKVYADRRLSRLVR